ncbi:hypothetical protein ACHAQH_010120, partial [Verticillium albo-atrum]
MRLLLRFLVTKLQPIMEIVQATECFRKSNGKFGFEYTQLLVRRDDDYFRAKSLSRKVHLSNTHLGNNELQDFELIPCEAYRPMLPSGSSIAPEAIGYLKQPKLLSFKDNSDLTESLLKELAACESVKRRPHPNLAAFHGCHVIEGRIAGFYFEKYVETLMAKVNPGHLNK